LNWLDYPVLTEKIHNGIETMCRSQTCRLVNIPLFAARTLLNAGLKLRLCVFMAY
jgi:hypothetical protein